MDAIVHAGLELSETRLTVAQAHPVVRHCAGHQRDRVLAWMKDAPFEVLIDVDKSRSHGNVGVSHGIC